MSRAWILVSRALLSKYRKMSRPKKPCHGHFLGFLSRALILMSRPLFLVQNCHGLFFDVTAIFSKNVTGTKTNVTSKKKHWVTHRSILKVKSFWGVIVSGPKKRWLWWQRTYIGLLVFRLKSTRFEHTYIISYNGNVNSPTRPPPPLNRGD